MKSQLDVFKNKFSKYFETNRNKKLFLIFTIIVLLFLLVPKKKTKTISEPIGGPKIILTPEKKSTP